MLRIAYKSRRFLDLLEIVLTDLKWLSRNHVSRANFNTRLFKLRVKLLYWQIYSKVYDHHVEHFTNVQR